MEGKFEDRIMSENMCHQRIANVNLDCKGCKHAYDDSDPFRNGKRNNKGVLYAPTSVCSKFDVKPNSVLLGGKCNEREE